MGEGCPAFQVFILTAGLCPDAYADVYCKVSLGAADSASLPRPLEHPCKANAWVEWGGQIVCGCVCGFILPLREQDVLI